MKKLTISVLLVFLLDSIPYAQEFNKQDSLIIQAEKFFRKGREWMRFSAALINQGKTKIYTYNAER
jgi:hypothetical protein